MIFRNYPFALVRLRFWWKADQVLPQFWPMLIGIAGLMIVCGMAVRGVQ